MSYRHCKLSCKRNTIIQKECRQKLSTFVFMTVVEIFDVSVSTTPSINPAKSTYVHMNKLVEQCANRLHY